SLYSILNHFLFTNILGLKFSDFSLCKAFFLYFFITSFLLLSLLILAISFLVNFLGIFHNFIISSAFTKAILTSQELSILTSSIILLAS
ncbi:MAG: hypothetical protein KAJ49_09405, partial [Arcobacteraceae bacterium]|nr:hypothetical protein [Arcobacteraceae bacterium]